MEDIFTIAFFVLLAIITGSVIVVRLLQPYSSSVRYNDHMYNYGQERKISFSSTLLFSILFVVIVGLFKKDEVTKWINRVIPVELTSPTPPPLSASSNYNTTHIEQKNTAIKSNNLNDNLNIYYYINIYTYSKSEKAPIEIGEIESYKLFLETKQELSIIYIGPFINYHKAKLFANKSDIVPDDFYIFQR